MQPENILLVREYTRKCVVIFIHITACHIFYNTCMAIMLQHLNFYVFCVAVAASLVSNGFTVLATIIHSSFIILGHWEGYVLVQLNHIKTAKWEPCARFLRCIIFTSPWWRHQMETFSELLANCVGNLPVTGEFPTQRPVTRSFDVFFDPRLNKRLNKQSLSRPSWRHCNTYVNGKALLFVFTFFDGDTAEEITRYCSLSTNPNVNKVVG